MTPLEISLESISGALQGVIPSPFATCSPDGRPNVTYMSIIQQVDQDRVALPRQYLNKTASNLRMNAAGQALVVDPETMDQYLLDLRYMRTETVGPVFEAMRSRVEATVAQSDDTIARRLRGVDIHRVTACASLREEPGPRPDRGLDRDTLRSLDQFLTRVAAAADPEDAIRRALTGLEDVFGFDHTTLIGHPANQIGSGDSAAEHEWRAARAAGPITTLIAVASGRRHVICVPNLARSLTMAAAEQHSPSSNPPRLSGAAQVLSVAAVPLVLHRNVLGVLYLESEQAGRFGPHNEHLLGIIGAHLAVTISALAGDRRSSSAAQAEITYYQADDSVFVDGEYLIKGVPGRILWKLLCENTRAGRVTFTNRELRLDESLELPPGNDNLDSRLIALRRRLQGKACGIELERVARGKLALRVHRRLSLVEVATSGPMARPLSLSATA